MRCLLIGASGFIGGRVRERLGADPAVTVIPAGRSGPLRLDLAGASHDELVARLRETEPDVVINCAGTTDGDPAGLAAGNVVAVARLLAALRSSAHHGKLIHLGSAAEYGPVPEGLAVPESCPPRPVSAYGMSKLAGTELVLAARRDGLAATVLRIFNPIGPGTPETLLPGRLVSAVRTSAVTGDRAQLGPLDGHRDFVDVRDVAEAVAAAVTAAGPLPEILNIGSGRATPLRDLAAMAAEMAGVAMPAEERSGSPRSAAVTWQQADITAAASTLGFQPAYPLLTSLRDMGVADPPPAR
ncbi:ADP-L-glycero-D-manno-heptose-6-epimerase [Actinoplanes sp. SE50]|uniref:NAD-dependent epimerase/dehydratase family protein n=1 Tax=unclassified Actinoplanes TaxID=2626549 RepID=UPI00023EBE44|nr:MULTISPECIES: NAD(P)-dependent oxidoreductase [unclassified Actinoplanes]AEV81252.1 ADP-L-glycero-D-manno-heptose-6-epimerase [Actinoplanes sp. SE50/110]ATO79655.1 ADP-L-glycero-D-manno-heptose-6-epimerase [Actinoplanes sp. SE50]SLL97058.1 ADP-glyceromanno-heptose 6-epimerase [Actinoplanes sp. SE50/110]